MSLWTDLVYAWRLANWKLARGLRITALIVLLGILVVFILYGFSGAVQEILIDGGPGSVDEAVLAFTGVVTILGIFQVIARPPLQEDERRIILDHEAAAKDSLKKAITLVETHPARAGALAAISSAHSALATQLSQAITPVDDPPKPNDPETNSGSGRERIEV